MKDIAKAALWPLVALIVVLVLIFYVGVGQTKQIEIGSVLKVEFAPEAAAALDPPSTSVASVLAMLSPVEMDQVLSHREGHGYSICPPDALVSPASFPVPAQDREVSMAYHRLRQLGLMEFRPDDRNTSERCAPGRLQFAYPTDKGAQARRYLVQLLTTSLIVRR